MKNLPWSEFIHKSGSKVWPSSDPEDSPFDTFECKHCGKILVVQMYGEQWVWEKSFEEKASDYLIMHLNLCRDFARRK